MALASTLAFILLALHSGKLDNSDMVTMSLSLILANAFGFLAAHRQARVSRHEFQAQEIERRALETQRQFVSMLSHEFRTPLATIDATVQRLGFALESQQPDFMPKIQKIQRAVARILNLLDNCLTDDRLAASDLVLHTEYVDLKDHIQRSYGESSAPSFQRLHLVLPDAPQWVNCDQHLIDIALSNLVNNALKYSPDNTPVTIRLEPDAHPGKIVIRVEDLGPGVPAADREQIFLKFFRSNSTQNVPGSGLGLHLARELVRRHGGNVRLVPESGHAGSIFTLTLPRSHLTHVMP